MVTLDRPRLVELGRFLKSRREMQPPADFGHNPSSRRRTPGLRREEVAEAAGISVAWYIRLEQGRDVRASLPTLDRIGKALRLDAAGQAYFLELARPDLDWKNRVRNHEVPTPELLKMLSGLMPHPTYILNRYWQVRACNRSARLVFGDLDNEAKWGGNLVLRLFQDERFRECFVEWPVVARSVVAQLRLSSAGMTNDPLLEALIARLVAVSPEFKRFWDVAEVAEAPLWHKALTHPRAGRLSFDFAGFTPPGRDSSFTVAVHTASDAATKERLGDLLASDETAA